MLLSVQNNLDQLPSTQQSFLSVNLAASGTVVPVKNINGFTASWAQQIGKTGEEQAEIAIISGAPAGTAFNTSGTIRYAHPQDTPVYQIHYDKIIFLRSTNGTAGTATALATVSITPDSFYTQYDDTSGISTYAYQTQYYNSISGDVSGTSSWFVPGGPSFYSLQKIRDRIKHDIYSAGYIKDDNTIHDWINEYVEVMTNSALKVNQGYALGTAAYSFGTAGLGTITEPLFKYATKVEITTDGVSYVNSTEIPINQFSSTDTYSKSAPRHYWQGNTVFGVLPNGNSGTARLTLGELSAQLVNDSDELPQFLKAYTTGCIEYGQYKAFDLDQKGSDADRHFQKFLVYQNAFIAEITPRDQTGIKFINLSEGLSGDDDYYLI
jgi:hypothetical protein